jgi:acyl dehydratase
MDTPQRGQTYFEDVDIGSEILAIEKKITTRQLVKWAGSSQDYFEIHYDKDVALEKGLPGVIVHGRIKAAFLGQMLTDWIGEEGTLRRFSCQYKGMDQPGHTLKCLGKVTNKRILDGLNLVDCEVWISNDAGQITTTGTATVALPSRN